MSAVYAAKWAFFILFGYFLGGVLFSWHIPKLLKGIDVCQASGDHNPGAANVFMFAGRQVGFLCLFCDLMKGFIPVMFALKMLNIGNILFAAVIAAPVLGHATAPFYRMSGGKSIAVSFGVYLALLPVTYVVAVLAVLYIFFSTAVKIRPVRVRSILVFALTGVFSACLCAHQGLYAVGLGCVAVSAVVIVKHLRRFSPAVENAPAHERAV